jgi:hypothetical protein
MGAARRRSRSQNFLRLSTGGLGYARSPGLTEVTSTAGRSMKTTAFIGRKHNE